MNWIPQISKKEETKFLSIKSFKLEQEANSKSSKISNSYEDDLICASSIPISKHEQNMIFEDDPPKRKRKGPKSYQRSRKNRKRNRKKSNLEDIHDLLDNEESMSRSSSNSSFDSSVYNQRPSSKSFKRRSKGIKIIDGEKLSVDISNYPPKLPKIFNKQMVKYMQESDYSDGFSLSNSSLQSKKSPVDIKRDIRQDGNTPGLFIKNWILVA